MTEVLTSATFWVGVVGVAGILATLAGPMLGERRREKAEREKDMAEYRTARRLVASELETVVNVLTSFADRAAKTGSFTQQHVEMLATPLYEANKHVLAKHITDEQVWTTISLHQATLEGVRASMLLANERDLNLGDLERDFALDLADDMRRLAAGAEFFRFLLSQDKLPTRPKRG